MLRMLYVAKDEADAREKAEIAYENHRRFCNVFDTPGTVKDGAIVPIDVAESPEDMRETLLIGTAEEVIDKLGAYDELKVQDLLLNMSFGASHADILASMERFARDIMPHYGQEEAA
jgi:alkanesulfonate monooxygenase SsuD/methylene tetrahydromethanopterin reductase-like flavin-dependent oxidoreductase (luciferase family)